MPTIHSILGELQQTAISQRDKGDMFERLMQAFFKEDPLYAERFSNVWMWTEWPLRGKAPDRGIDLVAQERESGNYCAIQCKFYEAGHYLDKADIDSFFTESGKEPFTSRIIVSTTDKWSAAAEEALAKQQIPVVRMGVRDLEDSAIDWTRFSLSAPDTLVLKAKKTLRPHQVTALEKVIAGFSTHDRGKLIMACGTGKTFTALKIAEKLVPADGYVLFLVPSISLLSQTLKEWTAQCEKPLRSFAVCSDIKVGKKRGFEDAKVRDLAYPATTDAKALVPHMQKQDGEPRLTVVFSTYQSIEVVARAQRMGLPEFDLVICDEAHRTTGYTLAGDDESAFKRVHDQAFLKAKKRLYMTATPRIYADSSKTIAKDADVAICSMDDEALYGPDFHRLGFGESVEKGLLADYRVLVLAVDEGSINRSFQQELATGSELKLDDIAKIVGCWNGLSKRRPLALDTEDGGFASDPSPMRRAVAFSRKIDDSKTIATMFESIVAKYTGADNAPENLLKCEAQHVDGSMNVLQRNEKLDWLKEDTTSQGNLCRILSNARCLTEGVDVPALDAVLFLNPRDSVVDVVQAVGRVMRTSEGKKYGYIILPIGIPAGVPPEQALQDNDKYKVVWQVLQALRAHDDRFNALVNKIELNKKRDEQLQVIGVGGGEGEGGDDILPTVTQTTLNFPNIGEWRDAIYAKIVLKCGERDYWETWAKDVAIIAQRHIDRINSLMEGSNTEHKAAFAEFLKGLRENINLSISKDDAVEMLAQHLITKPVFDALFDNYSFAENNPVSRSMQKMLDLMEAQAMEKETESLTRFYDSVRKRASGIDNVQGKQKVIVELYDKFFRAAFPRMAERLGIVYTPVPVVDFILQSVDYALKKEFGCSISDAGVNVIDPFTGTGTFIVRLLQSGLIKPEDLQRKFTSELHANEIVLLAYYIAAINIEEAYHYASGGADYKPFEGIVLTDTFQLSEGTDTLDEKMFPENDARADRQKHLDIRVIVGNPPYSVGQNSMNDVNQNLSYPDLDEKIRKSYADKSGATNKNSLYDSYIRAFKWASERIKDKGVICYVSNGSYIDGNAADGFRKCLLDDFTSIYCFNLRGNQRTSGELSRMEGGKIFGSGSRAPIAITLLVRNPEKQRPCELFYHDIGDYLTREEKLGIISDFASIGGIPWEKLRPNTEGDWINQRDPAFDKFTPLIAGDITKQSVFSFSSNGIQTNRDPWMYGFGKTLVCRNAKRMIENYNQQLDAYDKDTHGPVDDFVNTNTKDIKWSPSLLKFFERGVRLGYNQDHVIASSRRPYSKEWLYRDEYLNHRVGGTYQLFPITSSENKVITVTGVGGNKSFSCYVVDRTPDVQLLANCHCFPLYYYEKMEADSPNMEMFAEKANEDGYVRHDAITDAILAKFRERYGDASISKEDIFYYVYGILHSPEYKQRFASDLKKMLPRIPFAKDFRAFSNAGRELAKWHLHYEKVEPYPLKEHNEKIVLDPKSDYRVEKMIFDKKNGKPDKSVIVYNSHIKLSGIPLEAYDYIVNGKSALDWIMERYQVTTDKDSGIKNDPNDWSEDPRYILDLVKRVTRVSMESVKIVSALPALEEE
jgi:predicted helicase